MLANFRHMGRILTIWIKCCVANHQRIIDVNKMQKHLGEDLCKALPAFHAFIGCDFNLANNVHLKFYVKAFVALSSPSFDEKSTFEIL